jgi:hypothetical protein
VPVAPNPVIVTPHPVPVTPKPEPVAPHPVVASPNPVVVSSSPATVSPSPVAVAPNQEKEKKTETETDTVKPTALLMKEMDETNNWARLGAQLYFGWFTLMITANGIAIGWLFSNKDAMLRFARLLFLFFIGLNLLGTIVAFRIRKHMLDCDVRIQVVLAGLSRHQEPGGLNFEPKSPVPREAINTVCAFTATVLFTLLIFWTFIGIWP